jgi:hypothetical protein
VGAGLGASVTFGLVVGLALGAGVALGEGGPVDVEGDGDATAGGMHAPITSDVASSSPRNRLEPFATPIVDWNLPAI